VQVVKTIEPVRTRLAGFRGSVFLKGSRRYELEKILESAPGGAGLEKIAC
jgi:UDP-N-acetylmuramoyl-tripeptide--D-alanyl-D-alanine ligase